MGIKTTIFLALSIVAMGCSTYGEGVDLQDDSADLSEVSVAIGQTTTRLSFADEVGLSGDVRWDDDDAIALWAQDSEGNLPFEAQKFNIKYYGEEYTSAIFTAWVESMSEGDYTYWGTYPTPDSVVGDLAYFTLPASQTGVYGENSEVMALPKSAGAALTANFDRDMVFSFKQLTHLLRLEIPADRNGLGEDIESLEITFPREVVGIGAVDFSQDSPAFTLSEGGSNVINVELADAYTEGSGDYIWVAIAAGDMKGEISVISYGVDGLVSQSVTSSEVNLSMGAGEISTITLSAGDVDIEASYNYFDFKLGTNNLNEDVETVTLTAPSGATFMGGVDSLTLDFKSSQTASYRVYYLVNQKTADIFESGEIAVKFESANALLSGDAIAGSSISSSKGDEMKVEVPYLLFEDFNNVTAFSNGDNIAVGDTTSESGDSRTITLTNYGFKQNGWTGDRVGSDGEAIRVTGRIEVALSINTYYNGRLDSPALSGLKNSGVKIKVEYDYKGGIYYENVTGSATPNINGRYACGYGTATGAQSGGSGTSATSSTLSTVVKTFTSEYGAENGDNSSTQSWSNIDYSHSYTIASASPATRISWGAYSSGSYSYTTFLPRTWSGNGNTWVYIDNVRVSIYNENDE